jgi:2-octaprenyl-6-methoxyphenol hydroxylase
MPSGDPTFWRVTAVNLLNRSLLSDLLPAQFARSVGLSALGALAPLRSLFMRAGVCALGSGLRGFVSDLGTDPAVVDRS